MEERRDSDSDEGDTSPLAKQRSGDISSEDGGDASLSADVPDYTVTPRDLALLRRVSGTIPWSAFSIAFVELCERFSYYGTTVVFVNFIQQPLPPGSTTGAGFGGQSGALGLGQRASASLALFNQFWAYVTPLAGAYIADTHLGRYKTIHIAIAVAIAGHTVLTVSAAPAAIAHPSTAISIFTVGLFVFGTGTGLFKANISPLLAEQQLETRMRIKIRPNGERVIVDPAVTTQRIFLYFYMFINIGSVVGQVSMVYAEKYVGFWLSFALPTVLFAVAPVVLVKFRKGYILMPPTGSILLRFARVWLAAMKGVWSWNFAKMRRRFTWDKVRPSRISPSERPKWMTYDDVWIDEVRRGLKACTVLLCLPAYLMAYGQMSANLTSQAATMNLHGAPNDIIQNLNPISIVIMIPVFDFFVYPALRKLHIRFTPIKRMTCGCFVVSAAMLAATITQHYVYKLSPCGNRAATCRDEQGNVLFADINVWVQAIPYILIGVSEIFTMTTGMEYAYSKAPENMRSIVMAVVLLTNGVSSLLAQIFVGLANDPLLVYNYGFYATISFGNGCLLWWLFRKVDADEDKWNTIKDSAPRYKERWEGLREGHGADESEMDNLMPANGHDRDAIASGQE